MEGANGALLSINSLQDTEKKRGRVLVEERAKKEISVNNAPHLSQNGKRYLHQHSSQNFGAHFSNRLEGFTLNGC